MIKFRKKFERKAHPADDYFRAKFRERLTLDAVDLLWRARAVRHSYPEMSGPELVRLVYWGASGASDAA